jgi:3-phosphoshikimate 1-carboxyvinyltransferase
MPETVSTAKNSRRPLTARSISAPRYRLFGEIEVPGDKSISHRAALLAAMSVGKTTIRNYLDSADTGATLSAARALGAEVVRQGNVVNISGVGLRGPRSADIDFLNASTPMSLSAGWLAGQNGRSWLFSGDASLCGRPVDRIVTPLEQMGASIKCARGVHPPIQIAGSQLHGIEEHLKMPSAQVKSCLMFAALLADGPTTVVEAIPARDHTERMLSAAGVDVEISAAHDEPKAAHGPRPMRIKVDPARSELQMPPVTVPGDFSSAAFFLVAAALLPGSEVRATNIGINPTRTGLLSILRRMGADLEIDNVHDVGGEPVADVVVRHCDLVATTVEEPEVPSAIDEMPLVALLGCFAEGRTVVSGAGKLRNKESDRIQGVVDGLSGLGAHITEQPDGFTIEGTRTLTGGEFAANHDHRLAMLGTICGLLATDDVLVPEMDVAAVSYPGFTRDLEQLAKSV